MGTLGKITVRIIYVCTHSKMALAYARKYAIGIISLCFLYAEIERHNYVYGKEEYKSTWQK